LYQDDGKAIEYLRQAYETDHPDAALEIACIYHRRLEFGQASEWYEKSLVQIPVNELGIAALTDANWFSAMSADQ
jgi:TPR repeat protein